MKELFYIIILSGLAACNNNDDHNGDNGNTPGPEGPRSISYSILNTYPHDTSSYTEGLLVYKGDLYESTGEYGESKLIKADLKTGKTLKSIDLDKKYFGEGIVILHDTIYQLTYRENVGFMYSLKDFKKLGEFQFTSKEGWGMTTDGKEIIATDGSSNLYYYQPGTFKLLRTQSVTEGGSLSYNLNELEYIDGFIYANQWQAPYIFKIDPHSGQIVGKADFSKLCDDVKAKDPHSEFFNGIAYDPATRKIYVTGKLWPELYEIQFAQ
jgi:glutaminyl-peptide cyclotransferase